MGLDMFLTKRIYVGAQFKHRNVTGNINITAYGKPIPINFDKVSYIVEDVAYWRKANAIHNWFVENVQDGVDDCREYYVSHKKLRELLDTCKTVLNSSKLVPCKIKIGYRIDKEGNKIYEYQDGLIIEDSSVAVELLPTTNGFFFGSTDYDEYYLDDIKYTIDVLEEALKDENAEFYYCSSW